jgi:hypothetical protein
MPEGSWTESHARDEYISESGIIGQRRAILSKEQKKATPSDLTFYNHMPAIRIRDLIGSELWNTYFKFTVVRNPFSKLVSAWYHMHRGKKGIRPTIGSLFHSPKVLPFIVAGKKDIYDFRQWILHGGMIDDRDKYLINGDICVDYFIKYEALHTGIEYINRRLHIDNYDRELPRFKTGIRSERFAISDFYDQQTEVIVRDRYEWEFDHFGYAMPDG